MRHQAALLTIAADLTASLASHDRHSRLLDVVRQTIPCDAAALLSFDGDVFIPIAAYGLVPDAMELRLAPRDHPRLEVILNKRRPVRFPPDSDLPDPFDHLIDLEVDGIQHIHACLGCPLMDGEEVVGALTADALAPHAFDDLDEEFLSMLGALAGAALKTTKLIEALEASAERNSLVARELQRAATERAGIEIIGTSPGVEKMRQEIDLVADSNFSVLILGETGVGKELVARAIHSASSRRDEPLIYVNCAALPETLAESELFGHIRGAFTGATATRAGKLEVADGGTLMLDEVGELPLAVQAKLLRTLQEGEIQRVGSDKPSRVDVRFLAATNRDLEAEVKRGKFRADLYHRLLVYPIRVPPLRERVEDVGLLADFFLDRNRRTLGLAQIELSAGAKKQLESNDWPGNVRELDHLLLRSILRARADSDDPDFVRIRARHLDLSPQDDVVALSNTSGQRSVLPAGTTNLTGALDHYRRAMIRSALDQTSGNWAAAARLLGLHRSNLHHLAKRLGITRR